MFYFIFFNLKIGIWDHIGVDSKVFIPKSVSEHDRFDTEELCVKEMNKRNKLNDIDFDQFYHYVYKNDAGMWLEDETFSLDASQVKKIPKDRIIVLGKGPCNLIEAQTKAYSLNYHGYDNEQELIDESINRR